MNITCDKCVLYSLDHVVNDLAVESTGLEISNMIALITPRNSAYQPETCKYWQ